MDEKSTIQILREVFGAQVRQHRRVRGWTQAELAEAADLSLDMISRLERGAIGPSLETIAKLSDALGASAAVLFGGAMFEWSKSSKRDQYLFEIHQIISDLRTKDLGWLLEVIKTTLKR